MCLLATLLAVVFCPHTAHCDSGEDHDCCHAEAELLEGCGAEHGHCDCEIDHSHDFPPAPSTVFNSPVTPAVVVAILDFQFERDAAFGRIAVYESPPPLASPLRVLDSIRLRI